jgi:EPS-associated MarR family transcriptional regulator
LIFLVLWLLLFNNEHKKLLIILTKTPKSIDPDIHFSILRLIDDEPQITQRELSKRLGISLGGVNYCLKALIGIGHIKAENFSKNPNKLVYLYLLTPRGVAEKAKLTTGFLKRKMEEYQAIKKEIKELRLRIKKA